LEEIKNTKTCNLKREVQPKKQELDTAFAEISRITQQMQEAKSERKEFDQRYISVVDKKQKELETYLVELRRLKIENEKKKEHIHFLKRELEKATLLKLLVEEAEKIRKILKR